MEKFRGTESEDYDVWWADLQAYFRYHHCSEDEKIALYNLHLGGEARKFVYDEDLSRFKTVEEFHELLRGTFSDKYDWLNVLVNMKQKPDELIRQYSMRLTVAAKKTGQVGKMLEKTCVTFLKKTCAPHLKTLINNCLPNTPFETIVEHAIQYERGLDLPPKQETEKKPSGKRKADELDSVTDEMNDAKAITQSIEKRIKADYSNTFKQMKDQINSLQDSLRHQGRNNSHLSSNSNNHYKGNNYRSNTNETRKVQNNVCLHCAKPNHRYIECRTATQGDKDHIRQLLRDRKFDFRSLDEKAKNLSQNRDDRFKSRTQNSSLNQGTLKQ